MSKQLVQKRCATAAIAPPAIAQNYELSSDDFGLFIRQEPSLAKVGKEKDRKSIDPPPVVQLRVSESADPSQKFLLNPHFFVLASLIDVTPMRPQTAVDEIRHLVAGTHVSSLHQLKDLDNNDGGFFVFGDLFVKIEGVFKIEFTLFEVRDKDVVCLRSITSGRFNAHTSKTWPGLPESTALTKSFNEQGVRLRLRRAPRQRLGPRGPASDNYQPRRYRKYSRPSSHDSLAQQFYSSLPPDLQSMSAQNQHRRQRQSQNEYPARHSQDMTAQPSLTPSYQQKRDLSQSDASTTSHTTQGDDGYFKRPRTEPGYPVQPSYPMQHYPLAPDHGGKLYVDASQGTAFTSFPQQSPYNSSYTLSPSSTTPRDQDSYLVPRRTDVQFPSLIPFDSTASRTLQRSPAPSYAYPATLQPPPQPQCNLQQLPQNFAPQLSQPIPAHRATVNLPMYPMLVESEQVSLPPMSGNMLSSEMLPPVFGRGALQGAGMSTSGLTALPSMGDDPRYARDYPFDYRQRDDHANR